MDRLEYLESERIKLWEKIVDLEDKVDKKTSEIEHEARNSSKKISEYKNKSQSAKDEAQAMVGEIRGIVDSLKKSNADALLSEITSAHENFIPRYKELDVKLKQLESVFSTYPVLADRLKKLEDVADHSEESNNKIDSMFNQLQARKKELDTFYYEIFGYSSKGEAGEVNVVKGRKSELENSFENLKNDFQKFALDKQKEIDEKLLDWGGKYSSIYAQIQTLLPTALTAGLSAAYSKKKDDEVIDHKRLEKRFASAIIGLVIVSFIPFLFSIHMMNTGLTLEDAILRMPRLVLSILPLYVPILWLAYSFNRKMNLSKRLIEEYTHKEVLSNTYEGLSTQINNLDESETSIDLKNRLLYNILEISSENPGKLISNYDKSDHPLMDVLDRGVRLNDSIDFLSRVPGMSKLVKILEQRAEELAEKVSKKASDGIESAVSSSPK